MDAPSIKRRKKSKFCLGKGELCIINGNMTELIGHMFITDVLNSELNDYLEAQKQG